jgi:hypothetical protein
MMTKLNTYLKDLTTQPIKALGSWNILLHKLNYIKCCLDHAYNNDHDENNLSEKNLLSNNIIIVNAFKTQTM